jgi:hypothetical protein
MLWALGILALGSGCLHKKAGYRGPQAPAVLAGAAEVAEDEEKVIVEAALHVTVADAAAAADAAREAVKAVGGRTTLDERGSRDLATLVFRVDPPKLEALMTELGALGEVTHRMLKREEVTRQWRDQRIELANLKAAAQRYREILQQAKDVEEILQVESELTRIRGRIERIQGELAYLEDRVDLATLRVSFRSRPAAVFAPQVKLHPGARASWLVLGGSQAPEHFAGVGASLHFARGFQVDLDVLQSQADDELGVSATLGGDVYSDLFGRGERRWLNPYLGLRVGYLRVDDADRFTGAAVMGTEIFKTQYVLVDTQVRALAALGQGTQLALQPSVSAHFAF